MERFAQYLDDLDDVLFAMALLRERARRATRTTLLLLIVLALPVAAAVLAIISPPLAFALLAVSLVTLLYLGATSQQRSVPPQDLQPLT